LTYLFCVGCLMVLFAAPDVLAQNYSGYNWYFGNSTRGIRFSRGTNPPVLINNKFPLGVGGSAVATDQISGTVLFYTDGRFVYDAGHQQMPNGILSATGASGQNQPVAIAKRPGVENQFYIFYRELSGAVNAKIVDMTLPGNATGSAPPSGDVSPTLPPPLALAGRSEAMITIPHANGEDAWLITHESNTTNYVVSLIQTSGITNGPPAPRGSILSAGSFSYHAATRRIAVAPREADRNVEILPFDNATGTLSPSVEVFSSGVLSMTTGEGIFDTEWSNSGNYLYISRNGDTGIQADVVQFDTRPSNPPLTITSVLPQPNTIFRSYGLQMAPDSVIYHLYQATNGGPFLLGGFTETDTVAAAVQYAAQSFPGSLNFNGKQFPNFAPADTVGITITHPQVTTCQNQPTTFFPTVRPAADSLIWDFGDGVPVVGWSPVHVFETAGSPAVTVTGFVNGQASQAFDVDVTVTAFDLQINLVSDTTACSCQLDFPKATDPPDGATQCDPFLLTAEIQGGSSPTMQWFGPNGIIPGATSATLTVLESGYYYLVVQDASGCSSYAGVNVKEYQVQDMRANIWHFGTNAGIDFNPAFENPPLPADPLVTPLIAPEGSAVICDQNGNLILSTNGQVVFDGATPTRNNITPLPNPPGLGGDPGSTQSSLIVPVPDDETLFYIFTTQEVHGTGTYQLKYSLFDLKRNGGTGEIVRHNVVLFSKSTERIVSNGNWLIAHEYGNNSFRAYRVTQEGISNPVISNIGSDHSFSIEANGQGYMEIGGNSMLAVALSNPGTSNVVEIFDFVDSAGTVVNYRRADLQNPAGQVYGLEFNGDKLYASIRNSPTSKIVELFFDTQNIPQLVDFPPDQFMTVAGEAGAIQRGPDGQIYVAVNGSGFLGVIQPSADTLTVSTFNASGFQLAPTTSSGLGLPNFIQIISDPIQGPAITVAGTCEDDSVRFSGTPRDQIDEYFWEILRGTTLITTNTEANFSFFVTDPGNYTARLRLHNGCEKDTTLTQDFQIFAKPAPPAQVTAVICSGPVTLDAQHPSDTPPLTYLWSTGATTQTIQADEFGTFTVTKTNAAGCSIDGEMIVADNRPEVDLGPDITICQLASLTLDAATVPAPAGTTYQWTSTPPGAVIGNLPRQAVTTTGVTGLVTYQVTVTTPGGPGIGCIAVEDIAITIKEAPNFTITANNPAVCGDPGSLQVNIISPASSLFNYTITGPSSTSGTNQSVGPLPLFGPIPTGVYGVTVTDQVTGCGAQDTESVTDNAFSITNIVRINRCDPVDLTVTHSANGAFTYTVFDAITGQQVATGNGTGTGAGSTFNVVGIDEGTYRVAMVSGGCTAASTDFPVNADPPQTVSINALVPNALCTNPISLTATAAGATTFSWTGTAGSNILAGNAATMNANPTPGMHTYTVTASGPTTCPNSEDITVDIPEPVNPTFEQSKPCATSVTLTADPASPDYIYIWHVAANPGIIGTQEFVFTGPDNTNVVVELRHKTSGCSYRSDAQDPVEPAVRIFPVLTLTIPFPQPLPCEDVPFTLTATTNITGGTFVWNLDGVLIPNQTTAQITDTRGGTYTAEYSVTGCTEEASVSISPAPADPGNLFDGAIICPEPANPDPTTRQVTLDAGQGFNSYAWFKDGVTTGDITQAITVDEAGVYSVELINQYGCLSTDETTVEEECNPKIVAPTAFRPSSGVEGESGLANREFGILSYFIDDTGFQVFIFNRWGEMVFQSTERLFRWNGGYNNIGPVLPAGTYTYVVRYKSSYRPEDGVKEKRGGVVLVR
jgi:hypothetical protein